MASKLLDILYERPAIAVTAIPLVYVLAKLLRPPRRLSKILKRDERVLVLGATSGIGREIAHQYSKRGARVCVVGRREKNVEDVVVECRALNDGETKVLGLVGDFSSSEDMVRIRETLRKGMSSFFQSHVGMTTDRNFRMEWARHDYRFCRCICTAAYTISRWR